MYEVKIYAENDYAIWNEFVANSKNGTFLFHRDFMEYHNDRFNDYSLLVFRGHKLVALLPANKKDHVVYSHQGLTYGGIILLKGLGVAKVEVIFSSILDFLKSQGIQRFIIKSIPVFYHKEPCFELEPLLHKLDAKLYRREQNLAVDYQLPLNIHKTKRKHFEKNHDLGFMINQNNDFSKFWDQVLIPRLKTKHNAQPVHTVEEITNLNAKFDQNILQYEISLNNELLAGITLFVTDTVVKSQYGAVTEKGEKYRALDYLFLHLINKYKQRGYRYFDMGIVVGNMSLLKQKEELGCRQYLQDFYELKL